MMDYCSLRKASTVMHFMVGIQRLCLESANLVDILHLVQIWSDPRFEAVPEPRRVQLFREFKAVLQEVEAYQKTAAAQEARRAEEEARRIQEQERAAAQVSIDPWFLYSRPRGIQWQCHYVLRF